MFTNYSRILSVRSILKKYGWPWPLLWPFQRCKTKCRHPLMDKMLLLWKIMYIFVILHAGFSFRLWNYSVFNRISFVKTWFFIYYKMLPKKEEQLLPKYCSHLPIWRQYIVIIFVILCPCSLLRLLCLYCMYKPSLCVFLDFGTDNVNGRLSNTKI